MDKIKLLEIRKASLAYLDSIYNQLDGIAKPLLNYNIDKFSYAKFELDINDECHELLYLSNHNSSFKWCCENVVDNSPEYANAIANTTDNSENYFILPPGDNDYVIKAYRSFFGVKSGITHFKRQGKYIEAWDFQSTYAQSILNNNFLLQSTIDSLSQFIFTNYSMINKLASPKGIGIPFLRPWNCKTVPKTSYDLDKFEASLELMKNAN